MASDKSPSVGTSDMSVLRSPIQLGVTGFLQLMQAYNVGTEEVKTALIHHCDLVMECKLCRSLFRGLPNFLAHKRKYCEDPDKNFEMSMENVRIVQPSSMGIFKEEAVTKHQQNICPQKTLSPRKHGHPILIQTLTGNSRAAAQTSSAEMASFNGLLPIPCEGICGLNSFIMHHKFSDKAGKICSLCKFTFPDTQKVRLHMRTIHFRKKQFLRCPHCSKVYTESHSFCAHLVKDHDVLHRDANKLAKLEKNKVEKFIIKDKVYDLPKTEKDAMISQKDFKEENRKTVLEMFKCFDVLEFSDLQGCKATCHVHSKVLEGFQSVRRHMVESHLCSRNVCLFCSHHTSSFGHTLKHMVVAHSFTAERIQGMKNRIKQHFSVRGTGDEDNDDNEHVANDTTMDTDRDTSRQPASDEDDCNLIAEWPTDQHSIDEDQISAQQSSAQSELSGKRKTISGNRSPESTAKKQKIDPSIKKLTAIKPVSSAGIKSIHKFIKVHRLMSPTGKCTFCRKVLRTYKGQEYHLRKHLSQQSFFQCKKCKVVFQKRALFQRHMITVHGITNMADNLVQKFVLEGGKVFDIPEKYAKKHSKSSIYTKTQVTVEVEETQGSPTPEMVTSAESPVKVAGSVQRPQESESSTMSTAVLYSEREMMLALITCLYTIKFQTAIENTAQCVHHPEVVLKNFTRVIEHLVQHHIKEGYSCLMCPFRRKDAASLVKHMSGSHHLSIDRIQRMKEKIRASLSHTECSGRSKISLASMSLASIEQIVAILSTWSAGSRDTPGADLAAEEESSESGQSISPGSSRVKLNLLKAPGKDLMLALIDCLGILEFSVRPTIYYAKATYIARCQEHPARRIEGLQNILEHLVDDHLKITNTCCLCGLQTAALEALAKHMSKVHNLGIEQILGMKEAVRFGLLRKCSKIHPKLEKDDTINNGASTSTTFTSRPGIPCSRCGKRLATFKKLEMHLRSVHYFPKKIIRSMVEKLRSKMLRAEQKSKHESTRMKSGGQCQADETSQKLKTKGGRMVRRTSEGLHDAFNSKSSMFGLEDFSCFLCGKRYPLKCQTLGHIQMAHNITSKSEINKYLVLPPIKSLSKVEDQPVDEQTQPDDKNNDENENKLDDVTDNTSDVSDEDSQADILDLYADGDSSLVAVESSGRRSRRSQLSHDTFDLGTPSLFGVEDLPCVVCMKAFPKGGQLVEHYVRLHHMERKQAHLMLQKLKYGTKPKMEDQPKMEDLDKIPEPEMLQDRRKQVSPRKSGIVASAQGSVEESKPEKILGKAEPTGSKPMVITAEARGFRIESLISKISKTSRSENVVHEDASYKMENSCEETSGSLSLTYLSRSEDLGNKLLKSPSPSSGTSVVDSPGGRMLRNESPAGRILKKGSPGSVILRSVSPASDASTADSPEKRRDSPANQASTESMPEGDSDNKNLPGGSSTYSSSRQAVCSRCQKFLTLALSKDSKEARCRKCVNKKRVEKGHFS